MTKKYKELTQEDFDYAFEQTMLYSKNDLELSDKICSDIAGVLGYFEAVLQERAK